MAPTEHPATVEEPQHLPPTDVTFEARMLWPYLAGWHTGGGVPQNGRELGCWIAGHAYGRFMHGEPGLRVQLPARHLAGACAVLLDFGLIVQRHSQADGSTSDEPLITLDVWQH